MKRFIVACVIVMSVGLALADDHDDIKMLKDDAVIVSLESILNVSLSHVPGRVIEVELKHKRGHYYYEIEVLDENNEVWELLFDAENGVLLKQEVDD